MSSEKIDDLFGYVQERCLWQFFSRAWDRQENIDGILAAAGDLLAGREPKRDTPMERLFYADARIMVEDFRARFPWIAGVEAGEMDALMAGLKDRLVEHTITRSLNHELNHSLY